jgi:hypothetical protein
VRLPFTIPPPRSRPFDVVGFGLNSLDLLTVVAEYPASNTKQRLQRIARIPGGQMATATAVRARLGWKACYVLFGAMDPAIPWNEAEGNPLADRNPYVGPQAVGGCPDRC